MSNSNLQLKDLTAEPSSSERSARHVTKFRLDESNKIKDYLNSKIKDIKDITKKISKYIVAFDYAYKLFITLSASFGTLSNTCRNSWSIFNFNFYRNDWRS